jgi:hypothetical protein
MSIRRIVLSCRAGVSKISLLRLRVKTRLPAPIKVISGIVVSVVHFIKAR